MYVFIIIAVGMAAVMFEAARRKPQPPLFVAGFLWLLYAGYEYLVDTGVLCDANCDIRADLLLFAPILYAVSHYAYVSYYRPLGQPTVLGMALGACGLLVLALLIAAFGYMAPASVTGLGALIIGVYAIKSKMSTK